MKYDVIIIGGGAAGSMLASRLAADAHTAVLLLEAGMASFQWQACGTEFLLQCLHAPCRQTPAE